MSFLGTKQLRSKESFFSHRYHAHLYCCFFVIDIFIDNEISIYRLDNITIASQSSRTRTRWVCCLSESHHCRRMHGEDKSKVLKWSFRPTDTWTIPHTCSYLSLVEPYLCRYVVYCSVEFLWNMGHYKLHFRPTFCLFTIYGTSVRTVRVSEPTKSGKKLLNKYCSPKFLSHSSILKRTKMILHV